MRLLLICGDIGGGAQETPRNAGIKLCGGVSGKADEAVASLLNRTLGFGPSVHCDHHDYEHGEGAILMEKMVAMRYKQLWAVCG